MELPILTANAILTVVGMAFFAVLVGMWAKATLICKTDPEAVQERKHIWINLAVLFFCMVVAGVLQAGLKLWKPSFLEVVESQFTALVGASLATYGYEGVKNAFKTVKPVE